MRNTVRFDRVRKGNPGGPRTKSYDDIQTNKPKPKPKKKQPNNPKPPKKQPYTPKPKKKQPEFGTRKDGKEKVRYPLKGASFTSEPGYADGYTAAYSNTKSKGTNWKSPQKPPSGPRTKQPKLCGCFPRLF